LTSGLDGRDPGPRLGAGRQDRRRQEARGPHRSRGEKFIADAKAQKLSAETIRKYENLLTRRFLS
jgi:hypothetical protein